MCTKIEPTSPSVCVVATESARTSCRTSSRISHLDAELLRGRARHRMSVTSPASSPDTRTWRPAAAGQAGELRVEREARREQHAPLTDHEERHREQQRADHDECAGANELRDSSWIHPDPSERMNVRTISCSLRSRSAAVPCAMIRPSCSIASSSPTWRALGMLCVTTTSVAPCSLPLNEQVVDLASRDRIETCARLVHEQDVGVERHRPRQPRPLPHATREFGRHLVVVAFEPDVGQLCAGPPRGSGGSSSRYDAGAGTRRSLPR
jgi:hypothetical protein